MAFDINPITPPQAAIFHLFPQLPTELRLKTWEHIFPPPRILKIRYNTSLNRYTTSTPSPITLSINHESREHTLHTYFQLLLTSLTSRHAPSTFSIPICFPIDTVYISDLAPILPNHMHDLLYNLSTCPARHKISRLAIDRRVWNELCDIGLLGVLCRMKNLQEVCMVVEFGRDFQGELTFLETPEWRGDLKWVAQRAEEELGEERKKFEVVRSRVGCAELKESKLVVKCVILMRGGEQA